MQMQPLPSYFFLCIPQLARNQEVRFKNTPVQFYPEDGGCMLHAKVSKYLPD
jgi:hypothetical protein